MAPAVSFVFEVAMAILIISDVSRGVTIVSMLLASPGFLLFVVSAFLLVSRIVDGVHPEVQVEGELQRCHVRNDNPAT